MIPALVLVVLAQASGSGAWSSARPPECVTLEGGRSGNVWERAKAPELRKYCDLLASGASKLAAASGKDDIVAIADEAEQAMPGRAAPRVLKGRALAQLGRHDGALAALREAKARDERALDDPLALFAWGRVLARTSQLTEATEAYRALLPRASMLGLAERSAAAIEAGLLAMNRGPRDATALDEATPIFRQAVRDSQDVAQLVSVLALALALDRAGDVAEARALLAERVHGDPRPLLAPPRARDLFAPPLAGEIRALSALALEAANPAAARDEWKAYADATPPPPWVEHARAHLTGVARRAPARVAERPRPEAAPPPAPPVVTPRPSPMVTRSDGLGVQEVLRGRGAEAKSGDKVSVHYVGTLPDGTEFDSSRTRNVPFDFTLGGGQVIRGFDEGVAGMRVGGVRRVSIPPALGYGARGSPPKIPPSSTLIFELELVGVQARSP